MSLDYSYKDVDWCQSTFHKSDEYLTDGNIIIPDSMDDIAKIISVKAQGYITDCKAEDGSVNISGSLKLNVIYIGENENNKICTLSITQPFSHSISLDNVTNEFMCVAEISSLSLNYSVVNSRRLKTTCALRFYISLYKNNRIKILCSAEGAQTKSKEITFSSHRSILCKNIVVSDNINLPSGKLPIVSILKQSAKITDKDFKVLSNKVIIKGNILVSILYLAEEGINEAGISTPFTEVIEAEGIYPSYHTNLTLSVADCSLTPDTDLSGEYTMLDASIVLSASLTSFVNENVNVIDDIYLPGNALKTETVKIKMNNNLHNVSEDEFIKENVTLSKNASIRRIVDADCRITDLFMSDNVASGNAEIAFIYQSSDSDSVLNTYTAKIPVSHKFTEQNVVNPIGIPNHIGYAITGDNTIDIRLGMTFSATSSNNDEMNIITDCRECDYTPPHRPSIIVSVVKQGDSLWDIAKEHNISVSHLATANNLDENSVLTIGDKLLIPR